MVSAPSVACGGIIYFLYFGKDGKMEKSAKFPKNLRNFEKIYEISKKK